MRWVAAGVLTIVLFVLLGLVNVAIAGPLQLVILAAPVTLTAVFTHRRRSAGLDP